MHIHECVHIYSIARQIRVSNEILHFSILMEKYFLFNCVESKIKVSVTQTFPTHLKKLNKIFDIYK